MINVKQEFLALASLVQLFQKHIANRIDNQRLSILSDDALPLAGASRLLGGSGGTRGTSAHTGSSLLILLVLLIHHTLLATVDSHGTSVTGFRGGRGRRCDRVDVRNTTNTHFIAPGGSAGLANIAIHKLALALPAEDQRGVVSTTTENEEQTEQHGAQTRTESRVVVAGTLPQGEAILKEVVVTLAIRAAEDVGDEVQTGRPGVGVSDCGINLALSRTLVDIDPLVGLGLVLVLGVVGDEGTLDLVRVDGSGLLAVGFGDLFLIGIGTDLEEVWRRV